MEQSILEESNTCEASGKDVQPLDSPYSNLSTSLASFWFLNHLFLLIALYLSILYPQWYFKILVGDGHIYYFFCIYIYIYNMHPGRSLIESNQLSSQRLSSPSVSVPLRPHTALSTVEVGWCMRMRQSVKILYSWMHTNTQIHIDKEQNLWTFLLILKLIKLFLCSPVTYVAN